jgi:rhodanese-related sulfurtransferase
VGGRSARATRFLADEGVDARNIEGGIVAWHGAGLPVVQGS